MKYNELSIETWSELRPPDPSSGGYPSILLTGQRASASLHLFKDASGHCHLAIEVTNVKAHQLDDPKVNGLQIALSIYRFRDGPTGQFIDVACGISAYLNEFTEIVREVAEAILEEGKQPVGSVNRIINNWKSFWSNQKKESLGEEEQVGLLCELMMLDSLCELDREKGLDAWAGPLGEKHDFNFAEWCFEVKGTRRDQRVHTINGLDQLKPPQHKKLAFVSFSLIKSNIRKGINLSLLVKKLVKGHFEENPALLVRFNDLLASAGYSPVHAEEYRKFNVEVLESTFFEVDKDFPKLTSDMLEGSLDPRVSSIRYDLSLSGMKGTSLSSLDLGPFLK